MLPIGPTVPPSYFGICKKRLQRRLCKTDVSPPLWSRTTQRLRQTLQSDMQQFCTDIISNKPITSKGVNMRTNDIVPTKWKSSLLRSQRSLSVFNNHFRSVSWTLIGQHGENCFLHSLYHLRGRGWEFLPTVLHWILRKMLQVRKFITIMYTY